MDKIVEKEFQAIAEHYTGKYQSIVAVMAYGSRVHGKFASDSHYDCWFIVKDYNKFYGSDMKDRRNFFATLFNPFDEGRAHAFLNMINPNFYQEQFDGKRIKYGVISLDDFISFCGPSAFRMYVKGRFQKPVKMVYCAEPWIKRWINASIESARIDGAAKAAALLPEGFSLDELIKKVIELSYKADIRPENPNKQRDIFEGFKEELREIYFDLLPNVSFGSDAKKVRRYLFFNKIFSGLMNLKNAFTNRFAVSYVRGKIRRSREK